MGPFSVSPFDVTPFEIPLPTATTGPPPIVVGRSDGAGVVIVKDDNVDDILIAMNAAGAITDEELAGLMAVGV